MNAKQRIADLLSGRVLILDGAMGTELQKRGMPPGVCPETWCLEHPDSVAEIHAAYRNAGADCVYTATFGGNRIKMGHYGPADVRETNRALAAIARSAAGEEGLVAGDIGPTGRFVEPFGDLPFAEAVATFREQAEGLLAGGIDLFVIETMMDIQEARAALIAVREVSDLFTVVTMTYEKHGRTLNGTDPASALVTLQGLGADAVGCNCSSGPEGMLSLIAAMRPLARVPLVAKPNAGLPKFVDGVTLFDMDAPEFGGFGPHFAASGVSLLGGCCGTTPAHIGALRDVLAGEKPAEPLSALPAAASSARGAVPLEKGIPLPIGAGIDAAKEGPLRQCLLAGDDSPLRQAARAQEKEGARLLLVRPGKPGPDGQDLLERIVRSLAPTTRLPFLIDAEEVASVEAALRFYPGRPLLRIGEGRVARAAGLALAGKYGAIPVRRIEGDGGRYVLDEGFPA